MTTKSWTSEVFYILCTGGTKFCSTKRFATKTEALRSAKRLMYRWIVVIDYRAVESDDPVNCWNDDNTQDTPIKVRRSLICYRIKILKSD